MDEDISEAHTQETINKLRAKGGQDQLMMFLTGPAGSGKSTAVRGLQNNFVMNFVSLLESCGVTQHSCLLHTQDLLHH